MSLGCGSHGEPELTLIKSEDHESSVSLALELEDLRFVATVTNTGDDPVTISPSPRRILLWFSGGTPDTDAAGGPAEDAKPEIVLGETDDLLWLFPGETQTYAVDAWLRDEWGGWVVENTSLGGPSSKPDRLRISPGGVRVVPSYYEGRIRTGAAKEDPFFKCCEEGGVGLGAYCGYNHDSSYTCGYPWQSDEYALVVP